MRIAIVGKGGCGKSTLAGTLARLLARQTGSVLALDVDTMPGLCFSLGLGPTTDACLPDDFAHREDDRGWVVREGITAESLVERYALAAPDGVRFLQLGKLPVEATGASVAAFRHVAQTFQRPGWSIIADLAAGTRQSYFGWASFASFVAVVAEPTQAAELTARRLRRLAAFIPHARFGVVINKLLPAGFPAAAIADAIGLPLWAALPYEEEVAVAERDGLAPLDAAPESRTVAGVRALVGGLQEMEANRNKT